MKLYKCKLCKGTEHENSIHEGRAALLSHQKAIHGVVLRSRLSKPLDCNSPLEKIYEGERIIRDALKEIDSERNILQNRIKELDNLSAKYKLPVV